MDEDKIVEVKRKANEFIWQNGRPEMTIQEAEAAACALLDAMYPGAIPDYDGHANAAHREQRPGVNYAKNCSQENRASSG